MKKILMLILIFELVLTNCKKDKGGSAISIEDGVGVSFRDKSGNDLLDSTSTVHYANKDIHIYQVTNGVKWEYVPTANLDMAKDFYDQYGNIRYINKDTLHHCYGIGVGFLGHSLGNSSIIDTVLIELNKNTVDTATAIVQGIEGIHVMKVWYNGELKWERGAFPFITIVK